VRGVSTLASHSAPVRIDRKAIQKPTRNVSRKTPHGDTTDTQACGRQARRNRHSGKAPRRKWRIEPLYASCPTNVNEESRFSGRTGTVAVHAIPPDALRMNFISETVAAMRRAGKRNQTKSNATRLLYRRARSSPDRAAQPDRTGLRSGLRRRSGLWIFAGTWRDSPMIEATVRAEKATSSAACAAP